MAVLFPLRISRGVSTKLYDSYLSIYPELKSIFVIDADNLSQTFYDILLRAGCIYHSPNRITASAPCAANSCNIMFVRGMPLKQRIFRSGLGAYLPLDDTVSSVTAAEMFGLQSLTLSDFWNNAVSNISWSVINLPAGAEYLRTTPPFSTGYFQELPDEDGRISILRTGMPGSYLYYFYTWRDNRLLGMQIPSWQANNYEYRMLSNSCIYSEGNLPPAIYHVDNNIVRLKLQYLYPPSEQNMIRLYSWPARYIHPFSNFDFILALPVFTAIKSEFERVGYKFVGK